MQVTPELSVLGRVLRELQIMDTSEPEGDFNPHFIREIAAVLPQLSRLEKLVVQCSFGFSLSDLLPVAPMPTLQTASFLSDYTLVVDRLASLPQLRELNLRGRTVELQQGSDSVRILRFYWTKEMPGLELFPNLEELTLFHGDWTDLPDALGQAKQLKTVYMYKNARLQRISNIRQKLGHIESLTLNNCSAFRDWDSLMDLKQLRYLSLVDTLHDGLYASCDTFHAKIRQLQEALPDAEIEVD